MILRNLIFYYSQAETFTDFFRSGRSRWYGVGTGYYADNSLVPSLFQRVEGCQGSWKGERQSELGRIPKILEYTLSTDQYVFASWTLRINVNFCMLYRP